MTRLAIAVAVIACVAWAGVAAYEAWTNWPHFPLDLSHSDPGTRQAYDQAVIRHVAGHAVAGLAPLAVVAAVLLFRRSVKRRKLSA